MATASQSAAPSAARAASQKIGSGTLTLAGSNAYTGSTTLGGGTLTVMVGPLQTPRAVSVNAGGTLVVWPASTANPGGWTNSAINILLAAATFQSGANFGFDTTNGNFTYPNAISTSGLGLIVSGTSTADPDQREHLRRAARPSTPGRYSSATASTIMAPRAATSWTRAP